MKKHPIKIIFFSLFIGYVVYCSTVMSFQYQTAKHEYLAERARLNAEWNVLRQEFILELDTPDHFQLTGTARAEFIMVEMLDNCEQLARNEMKWASFETKLWLW